MCIRDRWDADAVVLDRESGTYADYKKVRTIDHVGKYFTCRGPLNTVPSPQGKPVMIQAGGSPKGRDFAAQHADAIVTIARGVEGMKEQTSLKHLTDGGGTTKTLRELVQRLFSPVELVGTPENVAKQMDELMEEVGGDGFLLLRQGPRLTRRYVDEICDGLVPALQRRGVVRTSYTYDHFRDNLLEF